jgi:hypothetical protein
MPELGFSALVMVGAIWMALLARRGCKIAERQAKEDQRQADLALQQAMAADAAYHRAVRDYHGLAPGRS